MTVSAQTPYNQYTGNALATVFPYQFKILAAADLSVYLDGVLKTLNIDYTVSGVGVAAGGSVTFLAAPGAAVVISIVRTMIRQRLTDYQTAGDFNASTVNPDFDNPVLLLQDLSAQLGRAIRTPPDEVATLPTLPSKAARSGKYISFDATGQPIASVGTGNDTALRTDLANALSGVDGSRLVGYRNTDVGAVAESVWTVLSRQALTPQSFGALGNDLADDTPALNAAYNAAKAAGRRVPLILPKGVYRFTSGLAWDGSVDIRGDDSEFSILKKNGNFDAITISGAGQQSRYEDFTLDAINDVAGRGFVINAAAHLTLQRILVMHQSSHGIELAGGVDTGFFANYLNLTSALNGGDALRIGAHHFASYFEDLDLRGNTGWGLNVLAGAKYHRGLLVVCQQNVAGGAQLACGTSVFEIYGESNTGIDITLTAASVNNKVDVLHTDTQLDFEDLGTNNQGFSISAPGPAYFTPSIGRQKRTTNVAGYDIGMNGGAAGAGAAPMQGGRATVSGGDSAGTGNVDGGVVELRGGSGIGTGREGALVIQQGTGLTVIGAGAPTVASAVLELISTTRAFVPPRMTTAQKNAIASPQAGMMVFDTTLQKVCVYATSGPGWQTITSV